MSSFYTIVLRSIFILLVKFIVILNLSNTFGSNLTAVEALSGAISSDQVIQVNTTEAFFISIKTSDYFTSSTGKSSTNDSSRSIDGNASSSYTTQPSTGNSSSVKSTGAEVELLMSVSGRADLPDWMYYKFDKETSTGYLYGSPVTDGDIEIEIIALNSYTYDTTMDTVRLTVVDRESKWIPLELNLLLLMYTWENFIT